MTETRTVSRVSRCDDGSNITIQEYEVEGARPTGRPKKTWTEIVQKDCQTRKLNIEDAIDRNMWRKQIKDD